MTKTILFFLACLFLVACQPTLTPLAAPTATTSPPASPFPTHTASLPATETPPPEPELHRITSAQPEGVFWSADGQTLVYAESINRPNPKPIYQWYAYRLATQASTPREAPFNVDREVWAKLHPALSDLEAYAWFRGGVSPSQRYLLYPYTEQNDTHSSEVLGMADFDGSHARKLASLGGCSVYQVIWFDQERKAVIYCVGEGVVAETYIVDIPQGTLQSLSEATSFTEPITYLPTISPDNTQMAIGDENYTLQIISLEGEPVQSVATNGFTPNWSADSQHLYYLQGQQTEGWDCETANIQVYDLKTRTNNVILESPVALPDRQKIDISCLGIFSVSPLENAAVFWSHGLWLVQW